jgi:uncharacterized membrane protein
MAKVSIVFGVLLVAQGIVGYFGTGRMHLAALIPATFGLVLGIFGALALSPSESRRKLFMHINVTVGLLGLIGASLEAVRGYLSARAADAAPDSIALAAKLIMAFLLFVYVVLCVRSFILVRLQRQE